MNIDKKYFFLLNLKAVFLSVFLFLLSFKLKININDKVLTLKEIWPAKSILHWRGKRKFVKKWVLFLWIFPCFDAMVSVVFYTTTAAADFRQMTLSRFVVINFPPKNIISIHNTLFATRHFYTISHPPTFVLCPVPFNSKAIVNRGSGKTLTLQTKTNPSSRITKHPERIRNVCINLERCEV